MKSERSKPGRAELIARWTARGLTWIVASVLLWFSANSLIYHFYNYDWDYSSDLDKDLILIYVVVLVLAYFFELAAGLACLLLGGLSLYHIFEDVWIFDISYNGYDYSRAVLLICLPLLMGALYLRAWLLGRSRVKAQQDADPGGIKTGIEFIFKSLADAGPPAARQDPEQDKPESLKKK